MPRNVRFFPVNHDLNADPEVWELTDKFGDRSLRVWLEILSIADRNKGELPGKWEAYPSILAGRTKSTAKHLATVCQWLTRWLDIDSEGVARVRNYPKYHKIRGENRLSPNLTKPNLTKPIEDKSAHAPFILPDWIPQKEWEEFKAVRKRKRAPLTDSIATRIIGVVDRLRSAGHDPAAVLAQAVNRNWTSIEFDWVHKPGSKEEGLAALYAKKGRTTEQIWADLQAKKKAGIA